MKQKKPATWGRCRYKLILTTMENLIPNNILGLEQAVKENREKRITEVLKIFVLMEFSGFIF